MPARILVVDDHQLVRESFCALLEGEHFHVVGQGADGRDAVRLAPELRPDLVLMDVSMPGLNGIDAAREILKRQPRMPIVLLTIHQEPSYVIEAVRAGVRGYVVKTEALAELRHALRAVLAGTTYLSPRVSGALVHVCRSGRPIEPDPLTPRERQVLQLVAEGSTTKDVALALDLTVKTAEYYRARIMQKLSIHTTAGLVKYALLHGLIELLAAGCCRAPCSCLLQHAIDVSRHVV